VPYRVEEGRAYVYDLNHPRVRKRFMEVPKSGEFECGGFRSREG
jgi:hypothetical protein